MMPWLSAGRSYWLGGDFDVMPPAAALMFLIGVLLALFLITWILLAFPSLWTLLISSAVQSDVRLVAVLRRTSKRAFLAWVGLALSLVGILSGPLLHALGEL